MSGRSEVHDGIEIRETRDPRAPEVSEAVALGRAFRNTLGFLPAGVYEEAAMRGTLVLAVASGGVVGYALYGLTKRYVRLTHLCVSPHYRRRGIARLLIDAVSERRRDYPGILVRCRDDYGLGPVWIKLGFSPLSEKPGRGSVRTTLVHWWRDHGQPNLFTRPADDVLVRASIDLNILRDLVEPTRNDAEASLALADDQFSDRIELVRTPALDTQINDLDGELRRRCLATALLMPSVSVDLERSEELVTRITRAVSGRMRGRKLTDRMDFRYVADSIAGGLNVFVTRDAPLAEVVGSYVAEQFDLQVLHPADVLLRLDELVRAEAYRPVLLQHTNYQTGPIGAGRDRELLRLRNTDKKESAGALLRHLRAITAEGHERVGVFEPSGELVAAYAAYASGSTLLVPLLRTAYVSERDTLARQLLFILRTKARETGATVIRIADAAMSSSLVIAASADGFVPLPGSADLYTFVLNAVGAAMNVEATAWSAADAARVPRPAPLSAGLGAAGAAELERRWWPLKLIDSELESWIVPIRQAFSSELLGEPQGLFRRASGLGLSREHVYYRSPGAATPEAPARILWYMSGSAGRGVAPAGVIACSSLDDVVVGTPEELFARFHHLGVWPLDKIAHAARDGKVQGLRFSNTEMFAHPVPLKRLRELEREHHAQLVAPSPRRISRERFATVYEEGSRGR
jgi:GNAT superfamily N-acetyltransferase